MRDRANNKIQSKGNLKKTNSSKTGRTSLAGKRAAGKAADWKTAVDEIKRCSGRDYEPALVEAFMRACEAGEVTIVQG